jgi:hypothetical protein
LLSSYSTVSTADASTIFDLFNDGDLDLSEDSDAVLSLSFSLLSSDLGLLSAEGDLDLPTDFSSELDLDLYECDLDFEGVRDLDLDVAERRDGDS